LKQIFSGGTSPVHQSIFFCLGVGTACKNRAKVNERRRKKKYIHFARTVLYENGLFCENGVDQFLKKDL